MQIDTDAEMLIPDEYVSSIQERLNLYTELDSLDTEEELSAFGDKLRDRFGRLPEQVQELFDGLRLRWVCRRLGFEHVVLKNNKLRCYFVENPQSPFYESQQFKDMLTFVQQKGAKHGLSFKKSTRHFILVKDGVRTLAAAVKILKGIDEGK